MEKANKIRHRISGVILRIIKKNKTHWVCYRYDRLYKISIKNLGWYDYLVKVSLPSTIKENINNLK